MAPSGAVSRDGNPAMPIDAWEPPQPYCFARESFISGNLNENEISVLQPDGVFKSVQRSKSLIFAKMLLFAERIPFAGRSDKCRKGTVPIQID